VQVGSWVVFAALAVSLLALDLWVFRSPEHRHSARRALVCSLVCVGVGLGFSLFVAATRGHGAALEYLTAYLIEESLSIDNLFVFLVLFRYFAVAGDHQHRVLFWGVVGAWLMRGIFVFGGVALIQAFHWVVYLLGAILVATGAKLGLGSGEEVHPEKNLVVRWASRALPMTRSFHGEHFAVKEGGKWSFTPLFLVLLAIESTDVMFAVDSVPAVLAVSRDVFVVYTSNIFAVLGLRALYFVLARVLRSLRFLRPALALILTLVGVKMLLSFEVEVPTLLSLVVVALILAGATALSVAFPERPADRRDLAE